MKISDLNYKGESRFNLQARLHTH